MLESLLAGYSITDISENESGYDYFGYTNQNDSWRIMRVKVDGTEYRFSIGGKDYETEWTGHSGLTYKRADEFK